MSLTSKFAILEAHPEYAVPTVVRKQTYMTVVAEPVLETIMEVLVASKPTENVPGAVCAAVEQICRGMASSLGDLSVDGQAILAYCVKYVDPVLRVRRHDVAFVECAFPTVKRVVVLLAVAAAGRRVVRR